MGRGGREVENNRGGVGGWEGGRLDRFECGQVRQKLILMTSSKHVCDV